MNKAAFLDRDGVINRKAPTEDEYITRWEEMHIIPGVAEAIALLNRAGFHVIVVSNQRCVAKGLLTTSELDALHQRMCRELGAGGAMIDGSVLTVRMRNNHLAAAASLSQACCSPRRPNITWIWLRRG